MGRKELEVAGVAALLGALVLMPGRVCGQDRESGPVAVTPHFAFYDDFETNLNDALIEAGKSRHRKRPELFHAGDETACFDALPPSARAGWDRAADYYAEVISPAEWDARQQYLIRAYLAGYDDRPTDDRSVQFVEIAAALRAAAAPAYRECRWAAQSAENRAWVAALRPLLEAHESEIAGRLQELYRVRWGDLPMRIDVVETVNWSGATTIIREPGGHILVSNGYEGFQALEIVLHEASHVLMARGTPVQEALLDAAKALNVRAPRDLWHVVLFYMTGEVVRATLERAGAADYTPIVYEIMERNERWKTYRPALDAAWRSYLRGDTDLAAAASSLVQAVTSGTDAAN